MEVLYKIRPFFAGIFPYMGLIYGRYMQVYVGIPPIQVPEIAIELSHSADFSPLVIARAEEGFAACDIWVVWSLKKDAQGHDRQDVQRCGTRNEL